jgi:hypothetical protein
VHLVIDGAPHLCSATCSAPALLDAMILAATGKGPGTSCSRTTTSRSSTGAAARAAHPVPERLQARQPLRLRHPPAVAGVLQEGQADRGAVARLAAAADGLAREGDGLRAALRLLARHRHRSPTGVEAEGWLISVGGTPREIMSHSPEFTYRRLLAAAEMARKLGAQIMGLGAFTKVVGDAGVTVAKRAPLPITTGNSYSASGALWAAHDALLRMNLLPRPRARAREVQGHGGGRHRRHRLGLRAAAGARGRGGLPGLARDRQAAGAEGLDPAARRPTPRCTCRRAPTRTSPRWT